MSTRRRLFLGSIVAITAIAMMTLPSFAAKPVNKTFTLTVAPTSVAAGTLGQPFDVTIKNTTPGNSNISSFSVNVPSQFSDVSAALLAPPAPPGSTNPNTSAVVSVSGSVVSVTNLDPIKRNEVATVRITVDVDDSCATINSSAWSATAWTGSGLNGDPFNQTSSIGTPTSITASCTLAFVEGQTPTSAQSGATITAADGTDVQVELISGSSRDTSFTGSVALEIASGPAGAVLTGGGAVSAVAGVATFDGLSIDTAGTYTLQATSGTLTSAASPEFTIYEEGINCGDDPVVMEDSGTSVTFERTDEAGSEPCVVVPYTLIVNGADEVQLLKDEATVRNEDATFILTITWGEPAGAYPDFGATEFDVDGLPGTVPNDVFEPDPCVVIAGEPQYPNNPDGTDTYWPGGTAEEPWCVGEVLIQPSGDDYFVTETFYGAGDPLLKRTSN